MADLEKLISDKTIADAQRREQQQADQGFAVSIRDESVDRIAADPELFARYLNMQGDNPAYSAGNIAMVMHQNPEATVVFTRDRWKDRGRFVLEAEQDKGCKIFVRSAPRRDYILTDTFDVAQTQGRDIWRPHLEDNTQEMETALASLLNYSPVQVMAQVGLDAGASLRSPEHGAGRGPQLFRQRGIRSHRRRDRPRPLPQPGLQLGIQPGEL